MIFLVLDFFYDWMLFYIYNSDGLKTRMPDATEIMKRVQNMTHLECPIYARKKFRMIFFSFLFFDDGGILSATGDRDRVEAFYVQGKKIR